MTCERARQRGTLDRGTGGSRIPSRQRCRRLSMNLPSDEHVFEERIRDWIATCVQSRTEVRGTAVERENVLVPGEEIGQLTRLHELLEEHVKALRRRYGQSYPVIITARYYGHYVEDENGECQAVIDRIDFSSPSLSGQSPEPPQPPSGRRPRDTTLYDQALSAITRRYSDRAHWPERPRRGDESGGLGTVGAFLQSIEDYQRTILSIISQQPQSDVSSARSHGCIPVAIHGGTRRAVNCPIHVAVSQTGLVSLRFGIG
jgi:hypothetical protein